MKLKKGSAQAKAFMKKLRDARGKKKTAPKKKISGPKRYPKPKLFKPTKKQTDQACERLVKQSLKGHPKHKISLSGNIDYISKLQQELRIVDQNETQLRALKMLLPKTKDTTIKKQLRKGIEISKRIISSAKSNIRIIKKHL